MGGSCLPQEGVRDHVTAASFSNLPSLLPNPLNFLNSVPARTVYFRKEISYCYKLSLTGFDLEKSFSVLVEKGLLQFPTY